MTKQLKPWKKIKSQSGPDLKLFQVRKDFLVNPRTNGLRNRRLGKRGSDHV